MPAAAQRALAAIGTWDGTTERADLDGPYVDPLQQEIPFGQRSYYLAPWRAYMDTWPAARLQQFLGVAAHTPGKLMAATAQVLAEAGFHTVRIEIGWGSFRYEDPARLQPGAEADLKLTFAALRQFGLRPLLLLNANSGAPCPWRSYTVQLQAPAVAGAREITISSAGTVRPGCTGLRGLAYQTAFPLITDVDANTGTCRLSAPLPKALPAGRLELLSLRYPPFGGQTFADGSPNPAAQETLDGWMAYVKAVCQFAKTALGTEGKPDAGFDLEVWNEYTFGSQFLDEKNYYAPARAFKDPVTYANFGRQRRGVEILLPMTVDYVTAPANKLPGVGVISGFANQRPWDNGADMWPGQRGFSRHYYTGLDCWGKFSGVDGTLYPGHDEIATRTTLNALGRADGKPLPHDPNNCAAGTFFQPCFRQACPEGWFFGAKTEMITRDLQPFPGPWPQHFRYAHPGDGRPAQVWMTETNTWRQPFADRLIKLTRCEHRDPDLLDLMEHLGAKALLRTTVFYAHKGVHTATLHAAKNADLGFALLPERFFAEIEKANGALTKTARKHVGPQVLALGRVTRLLQKSQALAATRPLSVEALTELKPRLVFKGDGTPEHPDRFNRDDFACLPFQLDAGRFAVAYYVVTRNLVHDWDTSEKLLAPERYDMPEQEFELTLGNVRGTGADVETYDPLTDDDVRAKVLARDPTMLTVRVRAVDYPRFLIIEEEVPGPLILAPHVALRPDGSARLQFATNAKLPARVSWGVLPQRRRDGAVNLPANSAQLLDIPALRPHAGVLVQVEQDGLKTRWPAWDWDVAGVRPPGLAATDQPVPAPTRVPPLLPGPMPVGYEIHPVDGLTMKPTATQQYATVEKDGDRAMVQLFWREASPAAVVDDILPEVSVQDRQNVRAILWNGTPAWQATYELDPVAHPGATELSQRYWIAPAADGVLIILGKGNGAAWQTVLPLLERLAAGVEFKRAE